MSNDDNISPTEDKTGATEVKKEEYYGYDLYPDRKEHELSTWNRLFGPYSRASSDKVKCERRVIKTVKKNPLVRILIDALEKAGCPFDIGRHISCEVCSNEVTGGYDAENNQIVVCQNQFFASAFSEVTIIHELIHMYDYCTNKLDFKNLDHLACTEIRAANLTHCSFLSSAFLGQSSPFNIKETHQNCVKMKAVQSVMVARNLDFDSAFERVLKVFDKCYNDLEPIGRRIQRHPRDHKLAYRDALHFGYCKQTKIENEN